MLAQWTLREPWIRLAVEPHSRVGASDAGTIAGYISDFPAPALLGRKDVLLMPHIGASTEEAERWCVSSSEILG